MKKKYTTQPPPKTPKNEKKQSLNSLIKNLRPKVYITDSSNFKNLVQELTGNGNNQSPVTSSPPSSIPLSSQGHSYHENGVELSFNSSCFSTPLEGSPDLRVHHESHDHCVLEESLGSQNQGFSSLYGDLEMLLMEMDSISSYDHYDHGWYDCGMNQQEVCVYDYDLSTMI